MLRFTLLTAKNVVLGVAPPALLMKQTCGVFSTCQSWAPIVRAGSGLGFGGVELNPEEKFEWNLKILYPRLVAACLVLQLGYGLVIVRGFGWVRWGGKARPQVGTEMTDAATREPA